MSIRTIHFLSLKLYINFENNTGKRNTFMVQCFKSGKIKKKKDEKISSQEG